MPITGNMRAGTTARVGVARVGAFRAGAAMRDVRPAAKCAAGRHYVWGHIQGMEPLDDAQATKDTWETGQH